MGDRSLYLSQIQSLLSQSGVFTFTRNEFKSSLINIEYIKCLYHLVGMKETTWFELVIEDFIEKPEIEFKLFIDGVCEFHMTRLMYPNINLGELSAVLVLETKECIGTVKRNNQIDIILNESN